MVRAPATVRGGGRAVALLSNGAGRKRSCGESQASRRVSAGALANIGNAGAQRRVDVRPDEPMMFVKRPLPRVLMVHCGGTLGMDPAESYEMEESMDEVRLRQGTGGVYNEDLGSDDLLTNVLETVPELRAFANLDVRVAFNLDSSRVGVREWVELAKMLHEARDHYDAFLVLHGTDTMAYTASALSFMLAGFRKPIIMTGSQLPLKLVRSDARQNLIDSLTCATANEVKPEEVCLCFGGVLLRGNRARKVNASTYDAFESTTHPPLARLGVSVEWNRSALLKPEGVYRPRFKMNPRVIRVPCVPGMDPSVAYGDLVARGVEGVVLEVFGVGNMPDREEDGWIPWLRWQREKGLQAYVISQCERGMLHPELYRAGSAAIELGVETGPQMTPEAAVTKMMLHLEHREIPVGQPIAGET